MEVITIVHKSNRDHRPPSVVSGLATGNGCHLISLQQVCNFLKQSQTSFGKKVLYIYVTSRILFSQINTIFVIVCTTNC